MQFTVQPKARTTNKLNQIHFSRSLSIFYSDGEIYLIQYFTEFEVRTCGHLDGLTLLNMKI